MKQRVLIVNAFLATNYWLDACHYAEEAERKASVPTLFDFMEEESETEVVCT